MSVNCKKRETYANSRIASQSAFHVTFPITITRLISTLFQTEAADIHFRAVLF